MHVRSCCFARIKHIVFSYVLVAVRVVPYLIVRRMNENNMAVASYHRQILSPKYGQTGNVKPLTANHGL